VSADDEPLLQASDQSLGVQISGAVATHKIPLQLILTSKLTDARLLTAGVRSNLIHTLSMDPQLRVRWLDDRACLEYLQKHFKQPYVDIFRKERRGSFRGDICRASVLYREGGFYTDLDLQLRTPLTQIADPKTTFMSCFTADNAILNAIIAAAPRSPVMKETLWELRKWYSGEATKAADPNGADGTTSEWMGPLTMLRGLRKTMGKECPSVNFDPGALIGHISCGQQEIMLYREAELLCDAVSEDCPPARMNSEFGGLRFGIFDMGTNRHLIGWPRFDGCTDWGCKSGGWDEADLDV